MKRTLIGMFMFFVGALVLYFNAFAINRYGYPMYNHYVTLSFQEVASENIVTGIYLVYRYYDTLFEAMMLLFSIIAVIYLSTHEGADHE